jgi:flagellar basal body rod protein FlgF
MSKIKLKGENMKIPKFTNQGVELDFEVVEEGWNEYNLSDGSTLRIRPIVVKIFDTKQKDSEENPVVGIASTNIVTAKVPSELKDREVINESNDSKEYLEFEAMKEIWNRYRVEDDFMLRVKLVVSQVFRTTERNQFGEPVYRVKSDNVVGIEPLQ